MNTERKQSDGIGGDNATTRMDRPFLLLVLAILLFAEAAFLFGITAWLILQLLTSRPSSFFGGVALILLALIAAVWVLAIGVGTLKERPWIRAAAVTWQVVQIAVAVGCFQGFYSEPALGWALLIPSVLGILLVLSPQVTAVTRRDLSDRA